MLRKSLVPSVLLLTITALTAMTSAAQADDKIQVPFKGSVVKACEFMADSVKAGALAGNDSVSPTQLSSKNSGGAAGGVTIKCNTSAAVSAQNYELNSKEEFKVSKAMYTVRTENQEEAQEVKVESGETQITVNLTLDSDAVIPAGAYAYNVLVSAVVGN